MRPERVLDRFTQRLNEARQQMAARAAAANARPQEPPLQRAEALVNQAGERVGRFAGRAMYAVRRFLARAREGFEDAWAEPQSRRGNGAPQRQRRTSAATAHLNRCREMLLTEM